MHLTVDNPYTGEAACTVPLADSARVTEVLDGAREAARAFRETTLEDRKALCTRALTRMEDAGDAIAADITHMMGKPLAQAKNEIRTMGERARYMIGIADAALADTSLPKKEGFSRRIVKEPLGVVLDLPAWNYPLLTAVNVVFPAVLAGNSVIVKHSPRSPLSGEHFARAFAEAGGTLANLVQSLDCDHATSEKLVGDARVDHVVFTGSVFGGRRMLQSGLERVSDARQKLARGFFSKRHRHYVGNSPVGIFFEQSQESLDQHARFPRSRARRHDHPPAPRLNGFKL